VSKLKRTEQQQREEQQWERAIALMMEAVITCETSVNFFQTTRRKSQNTFIFILAAVRA
jgi:F0F1-type ATP synthase gamma subunit